MTPELLFDYIMSVGMAILSLIFISAFIYMFFRSDD